MTLQAAIEEVIESFKNNVPSEIGNQLFSFIGSLVESDLVSKAIKPGDKAPAINTPDLHGNAVDLNELLKQGPVILKFYRGGWCPFCNLELKAWRDLLPAVEAEGATLLAISPETPEVSAANADELGLRFRMICDTGNALATTYGLVFQLPENIQQIYSDFNFVLPKLNGDDSWTLPIPATYVIDTDGSIAWADINANYTQRPEPADVLAEVRRLKAAV